MVRDTCNPSTWEAKAIVLGKPGLYMETLPQKNSFNFTVCVKKIT
jgi:hypothetical protein